MMIQIRRNTRFPRLLAALPMLVAAILIQPASEANASSNEHQLRMGGESRTYRLYTPGRSAEKRPLMIVLHGGLGNASGIENTTGMDKVARKNNFIVAYPNGTGGRFRKMKDRRTWNAGACCGKAKKDNVDDVAFIKKMIRDIGRRHPIDNKRIYVTGMSNGAMMAYRLACEMPDKIAAIIPVAGTLAVDRCDGANDIPILHIHGEQDDNVPVQGGKGSHSVARVSHRSVAEAHNIILRTRDCQPPEKTTLRGGVTKSIYKCSNGAPLHYVLIKDNGHVWPGGHGHNNTPADGKYFSASEQAWKFAKQFSKK